MLNAFENIFLDGTVLEKNNVYFKHNISEEKVKK